MGGLVQVIVDPEMGTCLLALNQDVEGLSLLEFVDVVQDRGGFIDDRVFTSRFENALLTELYSSLPSLWVIP